MSDEGGDPTTPRDQASRPPWPPVEDTPPGPHDGPSPAPPHDHQPLDFDPYRFGRPDHPIPPEYAPPGYVPAAGAPHQPPAQPPAQPPYPVPGPNPYYPQRDQYQYQDRYPHQYPGHAPRSNTKAVVALVLGILAILLFWLSIYDLVLIVPAIVLGALGRSQAGRDPQRTGRTMATSGLICGIVAGVLVIAVTVFVYTRVRSCLDGASPTSDTFQQCARHKLLND